MVIAGGILKKRADLSTAGRRLRVLRELGRRQSLQNGR
jgi:hypothetical protein